MICKFRMGERDLEKVANFFRSLSFFYVGKKKIPLQIIQKRR